MSKKHRTAVPDFSRAKPGVNKPGVGAKPTSAPAAPVLRAKPQSTSAKSGHRG
jgi:hypothetical protein